MSDLIRFGVSLEQGLLARFDEIIAQKGYPSRSEAIRDLIRDLLVREEWEAAGPVAGAVTLVYEHSRRDLVEELVDLQHDYVDVIVSTQHVHLDHDRCLEIVVVRGPAQRVRELASRLQALRGVLHTTLSCATTGESLR